MNLYWKWLIASALDVHEFLQPEVITISNGVITIRDVPIGGVGGVVPPNIFKFARKLVKKQPSCKRVGKRIFLVTIVDQLVNPPPNSRCLGTSLITIHVRGS